MVRTTVTLPEELLKRLKRIAKERDVPMAVVIREALEEKAAQESIAKAKRPKLSFIGAFDSSQTDASERASKSGSGVRSQGRPRLSFMGIGASGHTDIARRSGVERPGIRDWR
jgi:hypothetical protein